MTERLMIAAFLVGMSGQTSSAQTLPYDHLHLAAPDVDLAVSWYRTHLDGTATELPDRVLFDKVLLIWTKRADSPASEGGVIDHVGFSVPDVAGKVRELQAAGATVLTLPHDVKGLYWLATVQDPWGVKLEIVQDAERFGLHHVHLRLADPVAGLAWYADRFGGARAKLHGRLDGLRYDSFWLLIDKADAPVPASAGRSIDHLGWRVRNIVEAFSNHREKGDRITTQPTPLRQNVYGFIEDPNGVRIEVIQRPQF